MTDFKIRYGLSSQLSDPRLVLEENCWYLTRDTAELFLCINVDGTLVLKRINGDAQQNDQHDECVAIIKAELNAAGELLLYYSDGKLINLGRVVGKDGVDGVPGADGKDGADGLVTSVRIGEQSFLHDNGVITLPEFSTKEYVDSKFNSIDIPEVDLTNYATKDDIADLASETFIENKISEIKIPVVPTKVSELENDLGFITEHQSLEGFATETFVTTKIAEAQISGGTGGSVDLSGYATKDDIKSFITEVPTEYVTESELESMGYLKAVDSIILFGGKA